MISLTDHNLPRYIGKYDIHGCAKTYDFPCYIATLFFHKGNNGYHMICVAIYIPMFLFGMFNNYGYTIYIYIYPMRVTMKIGNMLMIQWKITIYRMFTCILKNGDFPWLCYVSHKQRVALCSLDHQHVSYLQCYPHWIYKYIWYIYIYP